MKLAGWQKRLEEHQARMDRLEASGEMTEIYRYDRKRFAKLYQRLGYLKQRVKSLKVEKDENGWWVRKNAPR